jgi:DMSO/TMAO reductase YedYZ heme-binding membrane subunit
MLKRQAKMTEKLWDTIKYWYYINIMFLLHNLFFSGILIIFSTDRSCFIATTVILLRQTETFTKYSQATWE